MRTRIFVILAFLVSMHVAFAPSGEAQSERDRIDLSRRGPQVGERVPDFSLEDQNGDQGTRESILGPNGAMLVFVRSADW